MPSNLYSTTKSIFGLVVAHAVMKKQFDPSQNISEYVRLLCPKIVNLPENLPFYDLLSHQSGISEIQFGDISELLSFVVHNKRTHSILGDFVKSISTNQPFRYSPCMGYLLAGAIFELIQRKTDPSYSVAKKCQELFFPPGIQGHWEWSTCGGQAYCNHTIAYSELKMTGGAMLDLGVNLLVKHKDLLEFIFQKKPDRSYVRHARSASASSGDHTAEASLGGEILIDYDYSYGWWIIPGSHIITAIGLGGQYLTIDLTKSLVGVRQQSQIIVGRGRKDCVTAELILKRHGFVINSHETFPLLVRDIFKGVDPNLERKRLFPARDVEYYLKIMRDIEYCGDTKDKEAHELLLQGISNDLSKDEIGEKIVENLCLKNKF